MNAIEGFYTGFLIITALALVALVAVLATWAVQFFVANRRERLARHETVSQYYRHLGSHAYAH